VFGLYASQQRVQAVAEAVRANKAETAKVMNAAQTTESGLLANAASQLTDNALGRDSGTAILLALEGLPDSSSGDTRWNRRP
jgi:hypothetical protein